MRTIKITFVIIVLSMVSACQEYLDVIPDNVPTLEYAFHLRSSAERYLFTCYSYMPATSSVSSNPAFNGADEVWYMFPVRDIDERSFNIAKGLQNASTPLMGLWTSGGLFQGIRDCNIFLENIDEVADIEDYEKQRWIGEVKFLKAYYHFHLFRMYGPIPVVRENLPLEASPAEVQVHREPVDEVVNYIVALLDEVDANENIPDRILGVENTELGRITRSIVKAVKAKVLVTAASPLFNGGNAFFNLTDNRGVQLFNLTYEPQKWVRAVEACKDAIAFCEGQGYQLYEFPPASATYKLNDTIRKQLDIRTAVSAKVNNTEVIWANTNSMLNDMQRYFTPILVPGDVGSSSVRPKGMVAPPLKTAEMFYTRNGLPIEYDTEWLGVDPFDIKQAGPDERFYIKQGEMTAGLHFNREPRFYASLGFDRGIWFGNAPNNYDVTLEDSGNGSLLYVQARAGERAARQEASNFSATGYTIKKLVHLETIQNPQMPSGNREQYPWPELRLADLYLLYAEALNEVNGYSTATTEWINKVRARAGIPSVEESWDLYSTQPGYYADKNNLREIIHQERRIELVFEGSRFWDLRRWLKAHQSGNLNGLIKGWDITQKEPEAYYTEMLLFNQRFSIREYLWPIAISELQINKNLVQNPGW